MHGAMASAGGRDGGEKRGAADRISISAGTRMLVRTTKRGACCARARPPAPASMSLHALMHPAARACRRLLSSAASDAAYASSIAFPGDAGGRRLPLVSALDTHAPGSTPPMAAFRLMDEDGRLRPDGAALLPPEACDRAAATAMYTTMVRLATMDSIFYDAQRQGRISFYMTNGGEEGIHVGTAAALRADDEIFAQYREAGVLMWRGFTLQNFADQVRPRARSAGRGGAHCSATALSRR